MTDDRGRLGGLSWWRMALAVLGSATVMSALLAALLGGGCDGGGDELPPGGTSENEAWVPADEPELDLQVTGWTSGVNPSGLPQRLHRSLAVESLVQPPKTVDVYWWPPDWADGFQFNEGYPANPLGPPPFRYLNISPRGAGLPTVQASYDNHYTGPLGGQVVDSYQVITASGRGYERSYTAQMTSAYSATAPGGPVVEARAGGESAARALRSAAATYYWYGSEWWFYGAGATLDRAFCQDWVDLLQSERFFVAVRFPAVPGDGDGNDYSVPLVKLPASDDSAPRLDLLDERQSPASVVLSLPLEGRPQWIGFAANNLPSKEGERWAAVAPETTPAAVCPQGLSVPAGRWEFYLRAALDYGGEKTACNNCVLEAYPCWAGDEPPFFLEPASGLWSLRKVLATYQGEGVTCAGPWRIRLASSPLEPPYRLSGPGFAAVQPSRQVQLHHTLRNQSSAAIAITFAATSELEIGWRLYRGTADAPNLGQRITGPVSVAASELFHFWVVGDVPGGASRQDTVTVTASSTAPAGSATNSDLLWIGAWRAPPTGWSYLVPSLAHLPGVPPTQWRSNLAVVNRSAATANLTLTYYPYEAGGATVERTATLAAGATVEWQDVLVGLFGLAPSAKVKGSVLISSDGSLAVTSRTFNQAPTGTYGQYVPAISGGQALAVGQTGVLAQLKRNAAFRTNVGLLAPGPSTVVLRAHGASGSQVGAPVTKTLEGNRCWQADDFFGPSWANAGDLDVAYVTVEVSSGSAWAYGSVVDNTTGDPTTIPALLAGSAGTYLIPSVAHLPGVAPTQWRTSTAVVNRGEGATSLTLTFYPYETGGTTVERSATLAAGATREWQDLLVELFGFGASDKVKGSVLISSTMPLVVTSRTFNQAPTGTYGQYVPAIAGDQALMAGRMGVLGQLKRNAAFRTNVGLLAPTAATVVMTAYDASGAPIGNAVAKSLEAGRCWQADDFFGPRYAGAGDHDLAWVAVNVTSGSAWAYGSVVDNTTGDPTTIPVQGDP